MGKRQRRADAENTNHEEHATPTKRPRTEEKIPASIATIPAEIRQRIIQHLIDPIDLLNSVESIESLRGTNFTFNQDVKATIRELYKDQNPSAPVILYNTEPKAFQNTNRNLENARQLLVDMKSKFEDFPITIKTAGREEFQFTRAETLLQNNALRCDLMPLESKTEKSVIVRDILRSPNGQLKYMGIDSLALNISFLEPRDRAAIVGFVCTRHKELIEGKSNFPPGGPMLGGTIKSLIGGLEYLARSEQERLLEAALRTPDVGTKGAYLEAYASKVHKVASLDHQNRIINAISADPNDRAFRLALVVENLDNMSVPGRETAARAVLSLDRDEAGRLWALSKLADKLGSLNTQTRGDVASVAGWELGESSPENFDDRSERWYTDPSICRVEIAYHLHDKESMMTERVFKNVDSFVTGLLGPEGSLREKAQVLPIASLESRDAFVREHLPWSLEGILDDQEKASAAMEVVQGMTLRTEDLSGREKRLCSRYLAKWPEIEAEKFIKYNISNHLDRFEWSDKNRQVRSQIEVHVDNKDDFGTVVDTFSHIARQAGQLDRKTLDTVLDATKTFTERFNDDYDYSEEFPEEYAALRSLTAFAAQSVANNCLATLVKGGVDLEEYLEPQKALEMTRARQTYDYRPRDTDRAR